MEACYGRGGAVLDSKQIELGACEVVNDKCVIKKRKFKIYAGNSLEGMDNAGSKFFMSNKSVYKLSDSLKTGAEWSAGGEAAAPEFRFKQEGPPAEEPEAAAESLSPEAEAVNQSSPL